MSYEPEFIKNIIEYNKEKSKVRTLDDWIKFRNKWYIMNTWPKKINMQNEEEIKKNIKPIIVGGRKWLFHYFAYDITPEAIYEYVKTVQEIGMPIMFPQGIHKPVNLNNSNGWQQECPFDNIVTFEIGDENCPFCGRKLVYIWSGD